MKRLIFLLLIFPVLGYSQTYNLTNKTIGSPNYGEKTTIEVKEDYFSELNRQNKENQNNNSNSQMLIKGARDAYGSGLNISGTENTNFNFSNTNSSQRVINVTPGAQSSEVYTVKGTNKNISAAVLILNGYFNGSTIRNAISSNGLFLIKKKYYSKNNIFNIDFKKLNKKEKLNLSIDNVILWRFDALRYNSSNDYKFKVRVIDNSGNIYFDGDFENISSAESVYSVIRAVNEETKKGN